MIKEEAGRAAPVVTARHSGAPQLALKHANLSLPTQQLRLRYLQYINPQAGIINPPAGQASASPWHRPSPRQRMRKSCGIDRCVLVRLVHSDGGLLVDPPAARRRPPARPPAAAAARSTCWAPRACLLQYKDEHDLSTVIYASLYAGAAIVVVRCAIVSLHPHCVAVLSSAAYAQIANGVACPPRSCWSRRSWA